MVAGVQGVDETKPNIARVYDYILGGKDNFAADRELAAKLIEFSPEVPAIVRGNRAFITAAVRRAAEAGVAQFLDLGAGLPTSPSVHEVVRQVIPQARVVYVDNDPVVHVHGAALLPKSPPGVKAVQADLARPDQVLADSTVRETIDLREPVGLILAAALHFFDAEKAAEMTADYMTAAAPGSWLMISILHVGDEETMSAGRNTYTAANLQIHGPELLTSWLGDWELVSPGITEAQQWAAGTPGMPPDPRRWYTLCAVAVKPGR